MWAILKQKWKSAWQSSALVKTIPIFLTINLVALVIWQLEITRLAMPLVLGVIAGGLVDLDNSFSGRVRNLVFSLAAFTVSSLSAQFALSGGWYFIPLAVVLTFVVVMLGALGQRYSTIAFGALVVAVYTTLTFDNQTAWYLNPLLILSGATLYSLCAILLHLLIPNRLVQDNLANAYEKLGAYLWAKSAYFDPDDDDIRQKQLALAQANSAVMQAFDQTRVSLFYRLRGHNRQSRTHRLLHYYFVAQEILERASSSHYAYRELFSELHHTDLMFRFQRVLELQASAAQTLAASLRHNERYQHSARGEKALLGLLNSLQFYREQGLANGYRWQSIADNLRHIESRFQALANEPLGEVREDEELLDGKLMPSSARLIAENISGWRNMYRAIYANFTLNSQLFRHALRLSLVVAVCSSLVQLFALDSKGYWILLTAIFVCQPNYITTKSRLIQRVLGTLFGVLLGMMLPYFSPSLEAQLGLLVVSGSLYTFFRFSHYGFSTFYITLLVLISLDIIGQGAEHSTFVRLFDTLLGTFIAWLAVSFVYPDWKYLQLERTIRQTLNSSAAYLKHITAQLQFGYHERLAYRIARRDVHHSLSALSSAVSGMHSEPKKYHAELENASQLLGLSYTLLGYISALGAYRAESDKLAQHPEFVQCLCNVAKLLAAGLTAEETEKRAKYRRQAGILLEKLAAYPGNNLTQTLSRQIRLIYDLLPQLQEGSLGRELTAA